MAEKGSMTNELFVKWLQHFSKFKPQGSILLIFDGAKCHLSIDILEEADRHNITLFCLPSNTTHELQPLDTAVFCSFEHHWDQEVLNFWRNRPQRSLSKDVFGKDGRTSDSTDSADNTSTTTTSYSNSRSSKGCMISFHRRAIVGFKGKTPHLPQYMPNRHHARFSVKVWSLCDSASGHLYSFEIYKGSTADEMSAEGATYNLVMRLMTKSRLLNCRYHLGLDDYFTSPKLQFDLYKCHTSATGTVGRNRTGQ
ncbi:tigger transposable element-derived protein 1-like [Plakobranchus ocellatus]|uniref:Tigger transposable element-derived protein 1-like n=1 Tax=Plakobranchus ocellatus TaxID=259542 RepID=A0AAV3ZLP2_9GAST|nr:tigger transposable element-derived protein 1-like [Plakobranchus ocellatus]